MENILKTYLKRLTNLSGNNKSLILKRLASEQFADLHDADFLLDKPSFEIISQLLRQKSRIPLCDVLDPRFEKGNLFSKRLRKIARTDQFITEERGTNDLYVGYPFIKGRFTDGTPVHAPLLFFPVQLKTDREKWCLFPEKSSEVILNQSFALAYSHFNQVKITDEMLEKSFDDFSPDPLEFRTELYEWLKETPFRINFNQDLFQDYLIPFSEQSLGELNKNEKTGELKLYSEAVLGIFPQAGSYLVPDYSEMLRQLSTGSLLDLPLFQTAQTQEDVSKQAIREEHMLSVFPSDIAQEEVIRATKKGLSLVVQGPPGTGKSQLICNLMADFAARGKKVLLVCQKRAALDVVHQRLQSIGLKHFLALIHDFRNDRASLYNQLHEQIERVDEYKKLNYSLDAVFLEREFIQNSRETDKILEDLSAFRNALYDESACGISVKQLYLTSSPEKRHIELDDFYTYFRLDDSNTFRKRLEAYTNYLQVLPENHSWKNRKDFSGFRIPDLQAITRFLKSWPEFTAAQNRNFHVLCGVDFNFSLLHNRKTLIRTLEKLASAEPRQYPILKRISDIEGSALSETQKILQEALQFSAASPHVESTLTKDELPAFKEMVQKSIEARNSLAGLKWTFFPSADKHKILDVLGKNNFDIKKNGLSDLARSVEAKIRLNHYLYHPAIAPPLTLPDNKTAFIDYFNQYQGATESVLLMESCGKDWSFILKNKAHEAATTEVFKDTLLQLIEWLKSWEEPFQKINQYFTDLQQQFLFRKPEEAALTFTTDLHQDFDNLVETDTLWNGMTMTEKEVINRLLNEAGQPDSMVITALFDNSIRLAWITHIESVHPELRAVSSQKMKQWETSLQQNIETNRNLSREIALIRLREYTYQDLENNRLGNRLTYRELDHQVTKKRKIWPVRKLLEHYHEEILKLVPCWMASPESVSAIFPMKQDLFDLVIFDEASQCYAEYGLPSMYRGKQVIITGDSKQLPPSNLYKARYEESETNDQYEVATETDALLDLAAQFMPPYYLTGHYRSQSLDLIDFSNQYFYNGKLRLLPDFHYLNQQDPGIRLLKTDGIWENNTNQQEAEKVIELVRSLSDSGKSIGIVTFNYFQQRLIQDLLEQETLQPEELFVKNIENVQGDERDIIIFSLGYAPDSKGKMAMQFGTLNMAGGENRLNVAITRARERIYIITSIFPSQLNTEQSVHEGPKLLKAYLQYAQEVSEGNFRPFLRKNGSYHAEWLLKQKLTEQHQDVEAVFPFADLAIRKNNLFTGLILTDDDLYHQSSSPKEPHANLPILLRQKQWPFTRIYSRQYWLGKIPEY